MSARCDLRVSPRRDRFRFLGAAPEPAAVGVRAAPPAAGVEVVVRGVAGHLEHSGRLELLRPAVNRSGTHVEPAGEDDLPGVGRLTTYPEPVELVGQADRATRASAAHGVGDVTLPAIAHAHPAGTVAVKLTSSVGASWRVSPADDGATVTRRPRWRVRSPGKADRRRTSSDAHTSRQRRGRFGVDRRPGTGSRST